MKKNILAIIVLLSLALTPLAGLQVAKADFLSCVAEGGNVLTCAEESQAGGTTTSFTDFQGGLQAPTTEGYAPALTQATDVRTYALNVSNFALGFLAIIAVLIIIYGGFLYVTAAGKEEQAGKGKKAISYAVIGILIILGSFAIVNTVLQAPGGKEGGLQGAAEGGQTYVGGSVQNRFNILANRVSTMAQDVVTAFQFHFEVQKGMKDVKTILDCVSADKCNTPSSFNTAMTNAVNNVGIIENLVSDKLIDSIYIKSTLDDLVAYINQYRSTTLAAADAAANAVGPLPLECAGVFPTELSSCVNDLKDKARIKAIGSAEYASANFDTALTAVKTNFKSTIRSLKATLREMYSQVGPITDIADNEFGALVSLDFLKQESVVTRAEVVDDADGELKKLEGQISPATELTSEYTDLLYDTLGYFSALYSVLKDILFVDARVTASVIEGNAPLVVNFGTAGSLDPSGLTINDDQIEWDLNGDGEFNQGTIVANAGAGIIKKAHAAITSSISSGMSSGVSSVSGAQAGLTSAFTGRFMNCSEVKKANVSCTFMQPGTYRVRVKIAPSGATNPTTGKTYAEEIGAGIASVTIKVYPPQTKIKLSVDNVVEGGSFYLMDYDDNGFLTVNRSSITVLASKAQNEGVKFNAKLTEAKEGLLSSQVAQGATIKWDFGDDSIDAYNKATLAATDDNLSPPPHKYEKEGTYTVTAEFKDMNGNTDRKIFTVVVSSIAPVMTINPVSVKLGDEVRFDGSNSASDNGPLKYKWNVTPALEGLDATALASDEFTYKFAKSGSYQVWLDVEDPITSASTAKENLAVTSKPPVSQFTFDIPKETQPGTVLLDGTRSYDPDGAGPLTYQWEINGQKLDSTADYAYVDSTTPTSDKAVVKFKRPGTYAVTLLATDPAEPNPAGEQPSEREVAVDNVLDIAWGANDSASSVLKANSSGAIEAPVTLTLQSETAVAYEVDYGDGEKESGEMSKTASLKHKYKEAGTFVVKASVYDAQDKGNSISRKVYVGSSTQPVAVIGITLNGEPIIPEPGEKLEISRKDVVGFDATASRNTDGTGRRLNYSWDLGDGERSTREKVNKTYGNTGSYKVTLKAINSEDVSQAGTDTFELEVIGEPPTMQSLTAVPTGPSLTTPVTVQLNAIGAVDADGKVIKYRWWYYDPSNDQDELGSQVSTSPNSTVTIGTRGEEGQEKTYKFAVEITDDENNTVSSRDIIDENAAPELSVTNGPNKAPVAKFNVDRTDIMVGDSVNFASSSTDPDGQIKAYYWDFEGDGFADDNQNEGPNVTHTFDKPAPNGIRVRLKVIDNNESESTSDAVAIYVEGQAQPPTAAFTSAQDGTTKKVKFTNTSSADTASGANLDSYSWDFDTANDANGDGKKDNDTQSAEKDPAYDYPDYGIYRAKLVVTDSEGNKGEVTNFVNVKAPAAPAAPVTPTAPTSPSEPSVPTVPLDARLLTTPAPSFVDNKIHLKGDSQDVTFDFSTSAGKIAKYVIDKNVYFDTNGNGIKDDDEDYSATAPGKWTTNFSRSYGNVRVRLTVFDSAGKKDSVDKDIVFDQTSGSVFTANIFSPKDFGFVSLMAIIAGFAIMSIKRRILSINKQK